MASAKPPLILPLLFSLYLIIAPLALSTEPVVERALVVAPSAVLQLSRGFLVTKSPGKPGKSVVCERVHIYGLSRIKSMRKFAHSLTVKVSGRNSSAYLPNAEVCFHRNATLDLGMCSEDLWDKVYKGSWVRHMSPFDNKLLDIRTASSSLESYDVSLEEEFFPHRIVFLVSGILMLCVASFLSQSLIFYYGSAMAVGIILVILVVLFQGMKLVPFGGRKLFLFIPSSIAGIGILLKQVAPGFLRSMLVLFGLDEELYDPVVKFLMAFIVLAGAWMGFWVVRKLVLTDDGSVDTSTAQLVAWSIRSLAGLLIFQSSADPVLAVLALLLGVIVSLILGKIRFRFLRRVYRKLSKLGKKRRKESHHLEYDSTESEEFFNELSNGIRSNGGVCFSRRPTNSLIPNQGSVMRTPVQQGDVGLYPSTFHATPERKRFSKQGWEKFTKDSTEKALNELASSPGFGKWLHENAARISLSPESSARAERQKRWHFWSQ